MIYFVRRGKIKEVQEEAKMNQAFQVDSPIRNTGETILHICAEYGQADLFRFFVNDFKGNIMAKNHAEETPFIIAAKEGRVNILNLYLEEYSKVPEYKFYIDHYQLDGWTALMYAAMNGLATTVELLAKEGKADVNHFDRF
jgi:ankyrin repeat protein